MAKQELKYCEPEDRQEPDEKVYNKKPELKHNKIVGVTDKSKEDGSNGSKS